MTPSVVTEPSIPLDKLAPVKKITQLLNRFSSSSDLLPCLNVMVKSSTQVIRIKILIIKGDDRCLITARGTIARSQKEVSMLNY